MAKAIEVELDYYTMNELYYIANHGGIPYQRESVESWNNRTDRMSSDIAKEVLYVLCGKTHCISGEAAKLLYIILSSNFPVYKRTFRRTFVNNNSEIISIWVIGGKYCAATSLGRHDRERLGFEARFAATADKAYKALLAQIKAKYGWRQGNNWRHVAKGIFLGG